MGLDMYLIKRKKDKNKKDLWGFEKELIYWRKANQIHNYFCNNGDVIEEQISYQISKEVLLDLIEKCKEVLKKAKLVDSKISNGWQYKDGKKEELYCDGQIIENQDEISEILPTVSGFFFGNTEYNNYYIEDIKYTLENLEQVIDLIDFENEDVFYLASW